MHAFSAVVVTFLILKNNFGSSSGIRTPDSLGFSNLFMIIVIVHD